MTQINLLPWREKLREQRKQRFFFFLSCSAASGLLIMFFTHSINSHRINYQESRNAFLRSEIQQMDQRIVQIKALQKIKTDMLARMGIIQELQINRTLVVHFFAELPTLLPKGIYISKVEREGKQVIIEGIAESNTNVSKLMRSIETSAWMKRPVLNEIKNVELDNKRVNAFKLELTLAKSN